MRCVSIVDIANRAAQPFHDNRVTWLRGPAPSRSLTPSPPTSSAMTSTSEQPKTLKSVLAKISQQEDLNFLLTNRIPRRLATQLVGWFSKIEQPLVRDLSIAVWRAFS